MMAPKAELPMIFRLAAAPSNSIGAVELGTLPLAGTLTLAGGATGVSVVRTGGTTGALVVATDGTSDVDVTGGTYTVIVVLGVQVVLTPAAGLETVTVMVTPVEQLAATPADGLFSSA